MRTYDFSPMFRYSVGFDRMQRLMDAAMARTEVTYPPYNIEKTADDGWRISVAVAGFTDEDIEVTDYDATGEATQGLVVWYRSPDPKEKPIALLAHMDVVDALAEDCATDGVYEFFLTAAPIPVTGAVGAPVNPIAVK